MYRKLKELMGAEVCASHEHVGRIDDLLFDSELWIVRYFIVDAGRTANGRSVLISPLAVAEPPRKGESVNLALRPEMIDNSPACEPDITILRTDEEDLVAYYGWPTYWSSTGVEEIASPMPAVPEQGAKHAAVTAQASLQRASELMEYDLQASNDRAGQVEDVLVHVEDWQLRFIVVKFGVLGRSRRIISRDWIRNSDWHEKKLFTDLTCDAIQQSPDIEPITPFTPEHEQQLHEHYARRIPCLRK